MNAWIKIAEDTYEMLVNGGSIIRHVDHQSHTHSMVFVPETPLRVLKVSQ